MIVRNGDWTITTPGQVIDGYDIRGCVSVKVPNVTIKRSKITCNNSYAVSVIAGTGKDVWEAPNANLLLEDVEIDFNGQRNGKMIAFDGYTARRVWFHNGADCAFAGRNVLIVDSFCELPSLPDLGVNGPHYDGFQDSGSPNSWGNGPIVLRHNTVRNPNGQTSAFIMTDTGHVTMIDNLVAGGGYTIYCPRHGLPLDAFSGNVISRMYYARGGYWGPVDQCPSSGWRWDS